MSKTVFKLDHAGWAQVLKSAETKAMVHAETVKIAASTRALLPQGVDVVVDDYTTDRAASSVTIRHVLARLWQARDGVFTRAAAANGHEIRSKAK